MKYTLKINGRRDDDIEAASIVEAMEQVSDLYGTTQTPFSDRIHCELEAQEANPGGDHAWAEWWLQPQTAKARHQDRTCDDREGK